MVYLLHQKSFGGRLQYRAVDRFYAPEDKKSIVLRSFLFWKKEINVPASHLLRNIVRRFRTSTQDTGFDPIESTRRMIDLSDEIAAINRRILERSKSGSPEDVADRERLTMLTEELRSKPSVGNGNAQTA